MNRIGTVHLAVYDTMSDWEPWAACGSCRT